MLQRNCPPPRINIVLFVLVLSVGVSLERKLRMSREEMMQELTTLREVSKELETLITTKDYENGVKSLLDRYRKYTHELGNRIMVLDCKNLNLDDEPMELV